MGGAGGKGGGQTTTVKLPADIEKAAKQNLRIADEVAAIGYMPYQGPTVSALAPQQRDMMQNTAGAAQAFGMAGPAQSGGKGGGAEGIDPFTGLPMPQQFAGGIMGYSPFDLYQQQIGNIPAGQNEFIKSFVVNPQTGAAPTNPAVPDPRFQPQRYLDPNFLPPPPPPRAPLPAPAPIRSQSGSER